MSNWVCHWLLRQEADYHQQRQDEQYLPQATPGIMPIAGQPVQIGKGCPFEHTLEQVVQVRLPIPGNPEVEYFLPVDKNPVHVRENGKGNAPAVLSPPVIKKSDGGQNHGEMKTHPERTVEVGLRRVVGDVGQFIQDPMRQEGDDGRQTESQRARFDSSERFLDGDSGKNMRRLLHVRSARVCLVSASETVDELFDQECAFAHGLLTEGAKPLGDFAEAGNEFRFVTAFDQAQVLLEGLDVVL